MKIINGKKPWFSQKSFIIDVFRDPKYVPVWHHSFSRDVITYAKFSRKLIFLTSWYKHAQSGKKLMGQSKKNQAQVEKNLKHWKNPLRHFFGCYDQSFISDHWKKRPWHRCLRVNFVKFLRTPFFWRTPLVAASQKMTLMIFGKILLISVKSKTFMLHKPNGFWRICHDVIIFQHGVIVNKMT